MSFDIEKLCLCYNPIYRHFTKSNKTSIDTNAILMLVNVICCSIHTIIESVILIIVKCIYKFSYHFTVY